MCRSQDITVIISSSVCPFDDTCSIRTSAWCATDATQEILEHDGRYEGKDQGVRTLQALRAVSHIPARGPDIKDYDVRPL